jgi:hypothetical protein
MSDAAALAKQIVRVVLTGRGIYEIIFAWLW